MDLLEHLNVLPTEDEIHEVAKLVADKTYSLYYVDYRDDLNHDKYEKAADETLNGDDPYHFLQTVDELVFEWDNWEYMHENIKEVKQAIINHYENSGTYDDEQINDIKEILEDDDVNDQIRYLIEERDDSTPCSDLMRNTQPYTLRVQLASNYEGMEPPHWIRGPIPYEGYIKQLLEVLNMNPALFKSEWEDHDYKFTDDWPDIPALNGQERVTPEALFREWRETGYVSQFTVLGLVDPSEFKDYTGKIKFHAGASFGFYDAWNGSGSTFEENIIGAWIVDTKQATDDSSYDRFVPHIDSQHGYSMDSCYGPTRQFWGEEVTLL